MDSNSSAKHSNKNSSYLQKVMHYVFALLSMSLICGYAYFFIFARFQVYDDEGFFLISIKQFLEGHKLYDVVYSIYQPFFYLFNWLWFSLNGGQVGHDTIRLQTIFLWVCGALVNGVIVLKITGSRLLGMLILLVSALHLNGFANEPGHPQALAYLLTAGIMLACVYAERLSSKCLILTFGILAGLLVMTKINIGVYATLAMALVLAVGTDNRHFRWIEVIIALLITALPTAIMLPALSGLAWSTGRILLGVPLFIIILTALSIQKWRYSLATILILSGVSALTLPFLWLRGSEGNLFNTWLILTFPCITLVLLGKATRPGRDFTAREWLWGISGFSAVIFSVCSLLLMHGTSVHGLLKGAILFPLSQPGSFVVPCQVGITGGLLALSGVASCCWYLWSIKMASTRMRIYDLFAYIKVCFGLMVIGYLLLRSVGLFHVFFPHFWMVPFSWLVLIPKNGNNKQHNPLPRLLIFALAITQVMTAYPVAGTQLVQAYAFPLMIAAVCLNDSILYLSVKLNLQVPSDKKLAIGCLLAFVITMPWQYLVFRGTKRYIPLSPLNLPGASMVRLNTKQTEEYREICRLLAKPEVSTFISMPGMNSFYLWAEKDPPTGLNTTHWMTLLGQLAQEEICNAVEQKPGILVLRNDALVKFWMKDASVPPLPLVQFINIDYKVFAQVGDYELMIRQVEGGAPAKDCISVKSTDVEK